MPSKIQVDQIAGATGSTVTLPSGQTLDLSSGTVTLPNSAVNLTTKVTGTLPVANGGTGITALGTAAQVLRVNSGATGLEFGTAPSGKLLQVVTATDLTTRSTSSTTFVTASNTLSVSITPSSASSKIFILVTGTVYVNTAAVYGSTTIYRNGSTNLGGGFGLSNNYNGAANTIMNMAMSVLDSPNTTSAITYQVYMKITGASGSVFLQEPADSKSVITAFEIGA